MVRTTQDKCYFEEHSCPKLANGECKKEEGVYCVRLHKIDALYDLALIPESHRKPFAMRPQENNSDAIKKLRNFRTDIVEHVKRGDNLYLYSEECGTGKTEWAYKLLKSYIGAIWASSPIICRGLFIEVPRYFLALKENITTPNEYVKYIKDNVLAADLVVFDEIGSKGLTEFEREQLLSVINTRISNQKSNIYTSNLSKDALSAAVEDRLFSRIINLAYPIEFKNTDLRKFTWNGERIN